MPESTEGVSEKSVLKELVGILEENDDIACVGPKIYNADGSICAPYCRRPSVWNMTLAKEDERPEYYRNRVNAGLHIINGKNDIKAGQNAGCQTALIGSEFYGQTVTVSSLKDFVEQYLK